MGTAVGLAYRGYRPVVEIQFDGFIYPAFDQIVCQVAKMHYRTQGDVKMPITIRIPFGGGIGAAEHHSESPEAYFTHTSGLRVVSVSNPQDAYTMIQQAIASDDPVRLLRAQAALPRQGRGRLDVDLADAAARWGWPASSPRARTSRSLTYGAAGQDGPGRRDRGRRRRHLDRGHRPALDLAAGLSPPSTASVRKTGRRRHHARGRARGGRRRRTRRERHRALLLPPRGRPGAGDRHDIPYPPAKLEKHHLPDLDRILDGVDRVLDRPNCLSGGGR